MSDKIKEAARARQKATGESYSRARMHVLAAHGGSSTRRVQPDDVTVVSPTDYLFKGRWRNVHLRLDLAAGAVRVVLDGAVLGDVPAEVLEGKARVKHGEYPLAEGWGVRVEPEYDEPDPEIGWEGGGRGCEFSVLAPVPAGSPVPRYRPSHVSISFLHEGTPTGWGGPSYTVSPCTFKAPNLAPFSVELEHTPKEGDVSAGVVDGYRRVVLRVRLLPGADGPASLVELGEPMPPEGAWSLVNPNFPDPSAPRASNLVVSEYLKLTNEGWRADQEHNPTGFVHVDHGRIRWTGHKWLAVPRSDQSGWAEQAGHHETATAAARLLRERRPSA